MKASLPSLPAFGFDIPRWNLNNNSSFTVASIKLARPLNNQAEVNYNDGVIYNNVWKSSIPKMCKLFLWTLIQECINTTDMLQRRLPTWNIKPSWCTLCKAAEEDRNHLFSLYPFSSKLWQKVEVILDRPLYPINSPLFVQRNLQNKG